MRWSSSFKPSEGAKLYKVTRSMAFMNIDDGIDDSAANEEAESSFQDESSSIDDEENSPELDKLYEPIACLSNSLTKSKERPEHSKRS